MKLFKRILALAMAVAMIATLAACGGGETASGSGDDSSYPVYTYIPDDKNSEQAKKFGDLKGTKIRVAESVKLEDWESNFYKQLEETTGMTVEMDHMGSGELATKIAQAVASGDDKNYFDVADLVNSTILNMVYGNLILPMDQYIYYDDPVWKYAEAADFNSLELFKIDGHYYGAPSHGYHETFIFYNKTYFEEMQAPDPYTEYYLKDNWTFETFLDTCKAVTKKRDDGSIEVAAWATWNYFSFAAAAGNDGVAQDENGNWDVVIDEPNGMAGLDVLYQCAKEGYLNVKTSGYFEFVNRKIAMLVEKPSSAISGTDAYQRMTDEIGLVPFPKMNKEQEKYICPMTVSGYGIAACAQNPAGAAAYVYYHRLGEQNRDATPTHKQWMLENTLNQESLDRRDEYIKKCSFSTYMIDGLTGWYNENRTTFLNVMFKDMTNPATAIDSMIPLIKDSLRKTVG